MAVQYEMGIPRNLVQFSDRKNLAFTDSGFTINDRSLPMSNVLWSSAKIDDQYKLLITDMEKRITDELKSIMSRVLILEQNFSEKLNAAHSKINAVRLKVHNNLKKDDEGESTSKEPETLRSKEEAVAELEIKVNGSTNIPNNGSTNNSKNGSSSNKPKNGSNNNNNNNNPKNGSTTTKSPQCKSPTRRGETIVLKRCRYPAGTYQPQTFLSNLFTPNSNVK